MSTICSLDKRAQNAAHPHVAVYIVNPADLQPVRIKRTLGACIVCGRFCMCGGGCFRVSNPHAGTYRAWTDFQITSHFLLACATAFSVYRHFYELALMSGTVVFFSVWYHRNKEEFGLVACVDSFCAKCFFMYGLIQTSRSASAAIFLVNVCFAGVTAGCFLATHLDPDPALYTRIHPFGLHICPGVWNLFVVYFHEPILAPVPAFRGWCTHFAAMAHAREHPHFAARFCQQAPP